MKLLLNMIVKNEAKRIVRALSSCVDFIDCYVITDTGSEDDTADVIRDFFKAHKIPGVVTNSIFKDWSQARNSALLAARSVLPRFRWDYAMLMDADMELVVADRAKFMAMRDGLAYDMEQQAGNLRYYNRRLVSVKATGLYAGVTHEYLDVHSAGSIPPTVAYFVDHADGANRPEKFKRDIRLLLEGLEKEPNNSRYYFYLAQSYREAGDPVKALEWYRKRVAAGGWQEEQWNAQVNVANCLKDMADEAGFIREMLIAYNMRPSRAEPLYDLANYFRWKDDKQPIASLFARAGLTIPPTDDQLFVNERVYQVGLKEEFSITGFYLPYLRNESFRVADKLSQQAGPYGDARELARQNLYHYMPKLEETCPSFTWKNIPFTPPEGWVAMNPSVALYDGRVYCVVRTVNYRINEHGQYLIRASDGTANDSNPIETRNYLLSLAADPMTQTHDNVPPKASELLAPPSLPCEFKPVIGFEDMRLFWWNGNPWVSSTVRQIHWDGNCEQVLARPDIVTGELTDVRRMLREPRQTEKNWAPIPNAEHRGDLKFMWRPGTVVDDAGKTVSHNPPTFNVDNISGGSQLVPIPGGWVALVHSAHQIPGSACRYYYHRFIRYDRYFKVAAMSTPFVFHDKVIEFAAGMCYHPTDPSKFVISYGYQDAEARIATVSCAEVEAMLHAES